MDLDTISGLEEFALGLALLLLPVPFLLFGAHQGHKLLAGSPGLFAAVVYVTAFLASFWTRPPASDAIQWLHTLASAVPLLLLVPSVLALRSKWLSVVHLLTLAGVIWSWFIGAMFIAHDGL
ncbi:hypothetical protein [Cognatiluteimonas weifangensis]|uniref:hypothetical protein n=1 Tax=Cognatiluteimonas weifangensis TaxID=2303539 RepID=UPI0011C1306C|nr:hypothetical protein [Luteimonas weifangensis]